MRIGIYGGTFAPPHIGHVAAAQAFMTQMKLDILYVIPAGIPPHKQIAADDDPHHRLRMCELAFANVDGVIVSDCEIRRSGKSYTVDTLREFYAPEHRLFLLCGTDMMLTLDQWREPEEIFRLCYPIYIRREEDRELDAKIIAKIGEYQERFGAIVRRVVAPPIVLSSTDVRTAVKKGDAFGHMVAPTVADYIREHGLYR